MRRFYVLAGAALLAAIGGTAAGRYFRSPPPSARPASSGSILTVPPELLNFGQVWETDRLELTLPVTNTGPEPVSISSWRTSCDCQNIEPQAAAIESGQTLAFKVSIRLRPGESTPSFEEIREVRYLISPRIAGQEDEGSDHDWVLRGRVRRFYRVTGDQNTGTRSVLAQPYPPDRFSISFRVPIQSLVLESDNSLATARVTAETATQDGYCVQLIWNRQIPVGAHEVRLRAQAIDTSGERLPTIAILRHLTVVPDVQFSPATVYLKGSPTERPEDEVASASSITGASFRLLGVNPLPENCGFTAALDGLFHVRVGRSGPGLTRPATHCVIVRAESDGRVVELPLRVVIVGGP